MKNPIILNSIFLCLLFTCFCSCIKQIEFEQESYETKLVVNSFLTSDSLVSVFITTTRNVLDTTVTYINDATVVLFENGIVVDTLNYNPANNYYTTSTLHPTTGNNYKIEVSAEGFDAVWAEDVLPEKSFFISATYTKDHLFDQYGDTYIEYTFGFEDAAATRNFYEILIFEKIYDTAQNITLMNYPLGLTDPNDILIHEGDIEYEPITMFFSDDLFNGENVSFYAKFQNGVFGTQIEGNYLPSLENGLYAELRSVSENYYQYRKFWTRHVYTQPGGGYIEDPLKLIFITEPIEMFSNIINGYGIFAGYESDRVAIEFVP